MVISLIIPIYNAEPFLSRLFENLEAQGVFFDEKEYGEVIFVNDGSPDDSEKIILEYAKKHPWVRCIRQENQGQHIARNTGIDAAKGEYIAFMDQDDAYAYLGLNHLLSVITKNNVDVVRGNVDRCKEDEFYKWKCPLDGCNDTISFKTGYQLIQDTDGFQFFSEVWLAIYRRNFIIENKIYFLKENYYNEDVVYNYILSLCQPRIAVTNRIVYYHIYIPTSDGNLRTIDHRLRRDANMVELIFFYKRLFDRFSGDTSFPSRILAILKRDYQWYTFFYFGLMIKVRGLRRNEIEATIKRFKDNGIYPIPHFYPRNLPEGYPKFLYFKILWFLISFIPILRMVLYFRNRV